MRPLKSLTLEALIAQLRATFEHIPDDRHRADIRYAKADTLMSAVAMLFFQHPSLLNFQLSLVI